MYKTVGLRSAMGKKAFAYAAIKMWETPTKTIKDLDSLVTQTQNEPKIMAD